MSRERKIYSLVEYFNRGVDTITPCHIGQLVDYVLENRFSYCPSMVHSGCRESNIYKKDIITAC